MGIDWAIILFAAFSTVVSCLGDPRTDSEEEFACLRKEYLCLQEQSEWATAIAVAQHALALAAQQHGEEHPETIEVMNTLSYLLICNDEWSRGEELLRKALDLSEALYGKTSPEMAGTLRMLANLQAGKGNTGEAKTLLARALQALLSAPTNYFELGKVQTALGSIYLLASDCTKCEAYLREAAENFERSGSVRDLAKTLGLLGQSLIGRGDVTGAGAFLERAHALLEKTLGPNHGETAAISSQIAQLCLETGDLDRAESLFKENLEIEQKLYAPPEQYKLFTTTFGLGLVSLKKGELTQAENAFQKAFDVVSGVPWLEERNAPYAWVALGEIAERRGAYHEAQSLYWKANRLWTSWPARRTSSFTAEILSRIALIDLVLGERDAALALADPIQDINEQLFADVFSFASERERLLFHAKSFQQSVDLWATLGDPKPLARAVLRTKGIVLDSSLEDQLLADGSARYVERRYIDQLIDARRRLAQVNRIACGPDSGRESSHPSRLQVNSLMNEIECLERSLATCIPNLGSARRALRVRPSEVQTALPQDAALLEMLCYQRYSSKGIWTKHYGALVLLRSTPPHWVDLGPADVIDRNVGLYQHFLRNPIGQGSLERVLQDLYLALWEPLLDSLPREVQRVIVSPDGSLNLVSFASLVTPQREFVGERWTISYVSSGRDLLVGADTATSGGDLLAWANPDFDLEPPTSRRKVEETCRRQGDRPSFRGLSFSPLPGAEKEGQILRARAAAFGISNIVVYVGEEATEAKLRRVQSPYILHLATHGFLLPAPTPSKPDPGTLAHAPASMEGWAALANPMVRSGLALAGAQNSVTRWARGEDVAAENDGIVTAQEIATLNLRNTWLVVLSACDSGVGKIEVGEGVLGLRRGFIQAGAKNLLLTLWPVDDELTTGIIDDFYTEAGRSRDPCRALGEVQKSWLKRLRQQSGLEEACRVAGAFILTCHDRLR